MAQISCTLSYTPRACPNCGVINRGQILKYGFYQAKHKYGQFRNQPLMLLVKTQRFQCPDCHTTFNATSYLFEKQRTISRDLRREVILRFIFSEIWQKVIDCHIVNACCSFISLNSQISLIKVIAIQD
nr:transposase family protein [Limosilactobacillus reuteri]